MPANDIRLYNDLYESCDRPSLYAAPWWLNATCGTGKWNVVPLKNKEGNITSVVPYFKTSIRGLSALVTPPLTQWLPVIMINDAVGLSLPDFLKSLPGCSILDITIKPEEIPILPNAAYRVNYKYSYIIPYHDTRDLYKLKYNEGLRRNLKEATANYSIAISDDIGTFLKLCQSSFHHRKMKPPSWLDHIVPGIAESLKKYRSGVINMAFHQGVAIAGILIGWDTDTTYYLTGGRSADEQGASAHALLLDHAISEAQQRGHKFDFEGSMHPGIANFFQSFGAVPEGYWQIRKFKGIGRLWSLFH